MMSFQISVIPVTLATCFSVLLLAEAKPYGAYGGMMPSAPIVDASPWMPMAQPSYYSGGYNSYQSAYGTQVAPLQAPNKARSYSPPAPQTAAPTAPTTPATAPAASPWFQPPQISEAPAPASQQWIQPNPSTPEVPAAPSVPASATPSTPAASPWFQPPQISEAPAPPSQWIQPNPATQEAPATSPWAQPNPTIPEVPAAISSASQQWAPAAATPLVPLSMMTPNNSSPLSPTPPVMGPSVDVPAITSPQPANTPVPQQPESAPVLPQSPPLALQPGNNDANVIFNSVPVSVPAMQGSGQDNWPETPRMVPEADNLPALPPATFGQFAVQPAR